MILNWGVKPFYLSEREYIQYIYIYRGLSQGYVIKHYFIYLSLQYIIQLSRRHFRLNDSLHSFFNANLYPSF